MGLRYDDVLDGPDRFEAELFAITGELSKKFGAAEVPGVGKDDSGFHG
jgi:hypothetical protein